MPLRALPDIHIDWVIEYTVSKLLFDVFCDDIRIRLQYTHSYIVLKSDLRADTDFIEVCRLQGFAGWLSCHLGISVSSAMGPLSIAVSQKSLYQVTLN